MKHTIKKRGKEITKNKIRDAGGDNNKAIGRRGKKELLLFFRTDKKTINPRSFELEL